MTASTLRLPAFAGNLREGPHHRRAMPMPAGGARAAGAEGRRIEPRDVQVPRYADDTAGTPGAGPVAAGVAA